MFLWRWRSKGVVVLKFERCGHRDDVTRLMCSPLAGHFWSTPVLVHKGLIHGVMTSLPWQTGLQSWQSCTIALAHSVGYKWRFHWDSPSEGLISYMWIQSDSDLTSSINFQGVCVTRLMCSPLAGNYWSTPVLVHKGLIHGVMTSLSWQTGLQSRQSCTIALAHSVGNICSQLNVQVQWCMTVGFGDQSGKAEKSWHHVLASYGLKLVCLKSYQLMGYTLAW